eukprot:PhF_6_TR6033/c0_g1_i2/m.8708
MIVCFFVAAGIISSLYLMKKWWASLTRNTAIASSCTSVYTGTNALKLMAFNSANYDDHEGWTTRLELILDGIQQEAPDVICLSEIRLNPDSPYSSANYQNMAEQILMGLNNRGLYNGAKVVVTPFMYYPIVGYQEEYACPKSLSKDQQTHYWEGLAVISKLPVGQSGQLYMPKPATGTDLNFRGTQHVVVTLPDGVNQLHVFNTHFGLDQGTLDYNAKATLSYMAPYVTGTNALSVLVGDMNADPTNNAIRSLKFAGLADVWAQLNPKDPGYTIPSDSPSTRIDYIWASRSVSKGAQTMQLMYTKPDPTTGLYASDHLGVVATFTI